MSDASYLPAVKPASRKVSRTTLRVRRLVQTLILALFLYLLIGTRQDVRTGLPHDLFFLADPLAGIAAMLGGRTLIIPMLIGGVVLLATSIVLGRVWCGWFCPLGTLLDWMPSRKVKRDAGTPRAWRQGKNVMLATIIVSALLGTISLAVFDPVTLLFRTLSGAILPLLNSTLLTVDRALYSVKLIQPVVAWFDTDVRIHLLGESPFYLPNLTLLAIFAGILALNLIRPRAWCRYLCPLGGLLGLVSRVSFVRRHIEASGCISCGRCAVICPTGAVDAERGYASDPAECTNCLDCAGHCPTRVITFPSRVLRVEAFQPERRQFIGVLGLAAIGAIAFRFLPSREKTLPRLIRPPGANEETLTGKCIRCGECVKICPTGAIQPVDSADAWQYTWTPHLQLRRGYCDYACNSCGQTCPTGAIARLSLEAKRKEVIGVAVIDEKRCIPFKDKKECIVCEEMCPLAPKAVTLKKGQWPVARPVVDVNLCNGCGICEHQCPVKGESAMRIYRSLAVAPPSPVDNNSAVS